MLYLDQDAAGNLLLLRGQGQVFKEAVRLADGERGNFADILSIEADSSCFGAQTCSFALGAQSVAAVFAQHDTHVQFVFLALEVGEEAVDTKKGLVAIEHKGLLLRGQLSPRRIQGNAMLHGGLAESRLIRAILRPGPGIDGALVQRLLLVRNDQVQVEIDGVAEALAALAGSVRIVEREQPGLGLAVDAMAELTLEGLRET